MKKRSEIEEKYKWDLSSYYKTEEEYQKDFEFVENNYKKIKDYEDKLNTESVIKEFLDFDLVLSRKMGKMYVFSSLKTKEDMTNAENQKRLKRLEKLSTEVSEISSFAMVELSQLSDEFLLGLANNKIFKDYDLFFKDIIKNKKHMLSKKEERLLALTGEFSGDFSDIFDMYDNADITFDNIKNAKGEDVVLNSSNYSLHIQSSDRELRKNAYKGMNGAYGKLNHMISANYMGNVKSDWFYSKIRGFSSCLENALYGEEVSQDVYNSLVKNVNNNLGVFHRFFDLKRQVLGLDKFAIYDVHATTSSQTKHYKYEQSFEIVKNALSVLGEDYVQVLDKAKQQRWIDVFANYGKDTGAFSWGCYDANPVVLLNYEGTVNCGFTLAHELGHMMHTYYSNQNQPYQKAGYEIFVAEVASTVNEMLMVKYHLKNANTKQDKLFYLDYLLKMFYSTVFRQTMFAEFEQEIHSRYEKSEDTTADALNEFYYSLNKKYFGEKVELIDEIKYEWSRIPHFYSSFYVYKYATGLISAFYIANKIYSGDQQAIKSYRKFLTLGSTMPPVELLKVAGVDLSDEKTFSYVFEKLSELLDQYKTLI